MKNREKYFRIIGLARDQAIVFGCPSCKGAGTIFAIRHARLRAGTNKRERVQKEKHEVRANFNASVTPAGAHVMHYSSVHYLSNNSLSRFLVQRHFVTVPLLQKTEERKKKM